MYHSANKFTIAKILVYMCLTTFWAACSVDSYAAGAPLTKGSKRLTGNLSVVSSDISLLPPHKVLKRKPKRAQIFEYDCQPLGDRSAFLFVHGLRGEYHPGLRWRMVAKKFVDSPEFASKYKIYLLRYDSLARLDDTTPQFREAILKLRQATAERPITVMALSLGGNLVYEGMQDKSVYDSIRYVYSLGTPYHGSPLFCESWLQYSIYKNVAWPWTRVDHGLDYRLYFHRNPSLLKDLRWDDADDSIPQIGHFRSRLPFGPHGDLTIEDAKNDRLIAINSHPFDKKKLITYGGYLLNPYMLPEGERVAENTILFPYTLFTIKVPAHLAREHPVLRMLNREISTMVAAKAAQERAGTPFLYQLNDGIAPVVSALYLPPDALKQNEIARESDLPKLQKLTDVKLARVFRNIDHLTFINGYRPLRASPMIADVLNPEAGSKGIFDWMLGDILHVDDKPGQLAREPAPNTVPANAD